MAKQEVWSIDIETKPMIAYVWDRRDVNIALDQLKEDWSVIAWSAKRLDEPLSKLVYYDLRNSKDYNQDKAILRPMWEVLNRADIIISHNGQSFDSKKLNARFILNGMSKPKTYEHFDTKRLASRVAAFTSTKLEYISEVLNKKYKKLKHKNFPGQSLWTECLKGNMKAWDEMKEYNIHDTLAVEEAALLLKEWAPSAFPDWDEEKCDSCGKAKTLKVKCQDCGKWSTK